MKKNWYAVFTKAHCEKKIAALLQKKRIENYCPVNKIDNHHYYKKKTVVPEVIFPGFVFVYITQSEMDYIRQTMGMVSFVYWLGKPAMIKEAEIDKMKYFTNIFSNIKRIKTAVNLQATVSITEASGIDIDDDKYLAEKNNSFHLSLPSLGYMLVANGGDSIIVSDKHLLNIEGNIKDIKILY